MSIGAVLDEAWTLFTRFFLRFFVIALVVFATINLLFALIVSAISADNDGAAFSLAILGLATAVIGTTWLQGAFVYAVQDARTAVRRSSARCSPRVPSIRPADPPASRRLGSRRVRAARRPRPVPMTIWAVIAPVIVLEKRRRSSVRPLRELVRGHGWTVFGIVSSRAASRASRAASSRRRSRSSRFLEIFVGGTIAQASRPVQRDRARDHLLPAPRRAASPPARVTLDPEIEARIEEPAPRRRPRGATHAAEAVEHMRIRLRPRQPQAPPRPRARQRRPRSRAGGTSPTSTRSSGCRSTTTPGCTSRSSPTSRSSSSAS